MRTGKLPYTSIELYGTRVAFWKTTRLEKAWNMNLYTELSGSALVHSERFDAEDLSDAKQICLDFLYDWFDRNKQAIIDIRAGK